MDNNDGWVTVGQMPQDDSDGWTTVGHIEKENATWGEAIKHGGANLIGNLAHGALTGLAAVSEAQRFFRPEGDTEWEKDRDAVYARRDSVQKYWDEAGKLPEGKELGFGGALASGVMQLPGYANPALAATSFLGIADKQGKRILDEGGDLETALKATGTSLITNAVFWGLPATIRANLAKRILYGMGSGVAGVQIEPRLINEIREAAGMQPDQVPDLTSPESVSSGALAATIAAAIGRGRAGPMPRTDTRPAAPEAPMAPREAMSDPKLSDQLRVLPAEGEIPRLDNTAEQNLVAGMRGLRPVDENAGSLLSLMDVDQYPRNDSGTRAADPSRVEFEPTERNRPLGDNRDMTGMSEDVPTMDFPLRQEVLDRPYMRASIEGFKRRLAAAETPEAKAQVENSFAAFMRKYGIDNAQDAHGLNRPLYESTLRDPMAVRKSNELALTKTETEIPTVGDESAMAQRRSASATDPHNAEVSWFASRPDGTVDLQQTLQNLRQNWKTQAVFPGYNKLMDRILSKIDADGLVVRVVDRIKDGEDAGLYRHGPNDILLRKHVGNNDYVLMHELVHAATARWIRMNANHPYVKELTRLRDAFARQFGSEHYGAHPDVAEFVAEAEANPKFQAFLKQQTTARTLWQRIKETWKNIMQGTLELAPKEMNALDRALELSQKVMDKQGKLKEGEYQSWAKRDRAARMAQDAEIRQMYKDGVDISAIDGGSLEAVNAAKGFFKDPSQSTSAAATPARQAKAYGKIPALKGMEHVSKDTPLARVKEMILNSEPIQNAKTALIGSKEMIASIKNSDAFYALATRFTNARKRADLYHRQQLEPLEKKVLKLTQGKKGDLLAKILKEEMFAESRYSPEELQRRGLSAEETSIYNDFRREFDVAIQRLNEHRERTGQEPVTAKEAYLSSRFRGDWKAAVFNKNGKKIWHIAETSKARAQAALDYLAKNYPDLDVKKSEVKYSKDWFLGEESMRLSTYKDMVAMFGKDDPAVQAMERLNEERLHLEGEKLLGHSKHLEEKHNIRGFLGDQPWKSETQNTRDLFKAQLAYLRNTHTWVELQNAVTDVNQIIGDKEVIAHDPKFVEMMQDVKKAEMGNATAKWLSHAERGASKWLGEFADYMGKAFPPLKKLPTDIGSINTGLGWAKAYFYLMKLGMFNIPFATVSVAQPVFTIPHHVDLTSQGYSHNPIKTFSDAMLGSSMVMLNKAAEYQGKGPMKVGKLFTDAYDYLKANGIGDLNQYEEAHAIGMNPVAEKIKRIGGMSMTESERFARANAFFGYVSHLEQSGKFKGRQHEMFQMAEMLTNKSMANYRHTERAGVFNKAGLSGNALSTLQTFKINQYNQLYDLAKKAKNGNPKPLMALLATQFMMAGALGMYALDDIEDLYEYFKQGAIATGVMKDKDFIAWSPKHEIARISQHIGGGDWFARGVPSAVTGNDYGSRMTASNVADLSFAGFFPFMQDYAKQAAAVARVGIDAARGRDLAESGQRALRAVAPTSIQKPMSMFMDTLTDPEGNPYSSGDDPQHLLYRRDEADKSSQYFPGINTTQEAMARDENFRADRYEQNMKKVQTNISKDFGHAVRYGDWDAAADALTQYIDAEGDYRTLEKQLDDHLLRQLFTEEEWNTLRAKGPQALKQLVRRLEFKR